MKKVGLITFHRPINFGAVLQSVALVKSIEKLGASCELIDYRNPFFEKMYSPFRLPKCLSTKSFVWWMAMLPHNIIQHIGFRRFVSSNTQMTKPIKNISRLAAVGSMYDIYITGSDQVWNLACSGGATAYFLDFVKDRPKNAYAASFGDANISEDDKQRYWQWLNGFHNISVRESYGGDIVKNITGRDCIQTLDPTLLLNLEQWSDIVKKTEPILKKRYVLLYFMATGDEAHRQMMQVARALAEKQGLAILVIGGSLHKEKDGICYVNPSSPEQFVALFMDAAWVVTNSFHGTAFSVSFEKNFYSYVKPDLRVSGRVESLLRKLGLQERIFSDAEQIQNIDQTIAYEHVRLVLEKEREYSIQYLKGVLYG